MGSWWCLVEVMMASIHGGWRTAQLWVKPEEMTGGQYWKEGKRSLGKQGGQ